MAFSRIIPSWDDIGRMHNPLTAGEEHLLKFLDANLIKDTYFKDTDSLRNYKGWLIFVQPYLNNSRPDIIIFNPQVGIQIIEVKDWDLEHYHLSTSGKTARLFVKVNGDYQEIKRPDYQVKHYKDKIINLLVPQIGEIVDKNKRNYGLIKTSLYFHNATTDECQNFFKQIKMEFDKQPVFGKDALKNEFLRKIIPDAYRNSSMYWDKTWNKDILFWLNPPYHSLEQGTPLNLSKDQEFLTIPAKGHHRIRGVAGSGKTQVLAYRAAKIAGNNKKVLVICFNMTLIHYIKDMLKRVPLSFHFENIHLNYYHGLCKDILNHFGKIFPLSPDVDDKREEFFKTEITKIVKATIENNILTKYDAILIDEGQDYYYEWYDLLTELLGKSDELVIACDKKQNIYGRDYDWLDKRITRKGLEKFGDWKDMKDIYRLPDKIANAALKFSEEFKLNKEVKEGSNNNSQLSLFAGREPHFIWKNIDEDSHLNEIWACFDKLKIEGFHPSDTTIILPYHKIGIECREFFFKRKIESNDVFGIDNEDKRWHKKSFYQGDSRLKMCTIHSFKGWETTNTILYIDAWVHDNWTKKLTKDNFSVIDSLIYTSITRSKLNVFVLNSHERYSNFGNYFSDSWI